jgi:hypothetical protein
MFRSSLIATAPNKQGSEHASAVGLAAAARIPPMRALFERRAHTSISTQIAPFRWPSSRGMLDSVRHTCNDRSSAC